MSSPEDDHGASAGPNGTNGDGAAAPQPAVRRSGRVRKARTCYAEEDSDVDDPVYQQPTPAPSKKAKLNASPAVATVQTPRERRGRSAKKVVEEVEAEEIAAYDHQDIVAESLAPMTTDERGSWDSWIELESEPSFFNTILKELGVKDAKIMELFSLDEDSLQLLPKPVHGLVFLYEYTDEDREEDRDTDSSDVWFANQTTDNACATVAMLNIVMNAAGIELGEKLAEFKTSTKLLSPAIRGYLLSTNSFLQTTHNCFARRLDLLNAALSLEYDYEQARKKAKAKAKKRKTKSTESSAGFHFIAYVQADGKVWELDGLQTRPRCLGETTGDLTTAAAPFIQERMEKVDSNDMRFNLLALCRSPVAGLQSQLALNIRKALALNDAAASIGFASDYLPAKDQWAMPGFDLNAELHRIREDVPVPADFQTHLPPQAVGSGAAESQDWTQLFDRLGGDLEEDWAQLRAQYIDVCRSDAVEVGDDIARVEGRKKDCTLLIHEWLKRLALSGKLREVFEVSQ